MMKKQEPQILALTWQDVVDAVVKGALPLAARVRLWCDYVDAPMQDLAAELGVRPDVLSRAIGAPLRGHVAADADLRRRLWKICEMPGEPEILPPRRWEPKS